MKIAICSLSEFTYVSEFIDAAVSLAQQNEVRYFLGYPNTEATDLLDRHGISYEFLLKEKPDLKTPASATSAYELFSEFFFKQAECVLPNLIRRLRSWKADTVLSHLRDFAGLNAAEFHQLPVATFGSHTNPIRDESVDPPFGSGLSRTASRAQRNLMWKLQHGFNEKLDEVYNLTLRTPFGLPSVQNSSTHASDHLILLSIVESLGNCNAPRPGHVHYVGPLCSRTQESPDPEEATRIERLLETPSPRVFLSLGATFGTDLKEDCLAALKGFEGTVITGFFQDVGRVIEASDAVVSVCGGKTAMDALSRAVPLIGLPQQGEQKEIALALAEQGAAILPCLRKWDEQAFRSSVDTVCRTPSYRRAASAIRDEISDAGRAVAVESLLSKLPSC